MAKTLLKDCSSKTRLNTETVTVTATHREENSLRTNLYHLLITVPLTSIMNASLTI